jgi:murein DD-endopeptidase MepM/ murein hydrolase activator NlpD
VTPPRPVGRTSAVAVLLTTLIIMLGTTAPAAARSAVERSMGQRVTIARTIDALRERRIDTDRAMRGVAGRATRQLRLMPGRAAVANPERFAHLRRRLLQERRGALHRIERSHRSVERRVASLHERRRSIEAWLETWGVFERCPIRGWHSISDNFGITVRLPDVPVHRHEGNDILAYAGTPIVAPFDGVATASSSELGGLEVRVTGARGYVYNAHLSSYGTLGEVGVGTVIGYVGDTGDATTAHDHLEWHPGGGAAVDPFPYLTASCG